jgi:hypothetical protein
MATATKLGVLNPDSVPDREWLGLRDLTRYAAISERTLREWIRRPVDPLPAVQVGTKILVSRRSFDHWMERHRIEPLSSIDVDGIVAELVGKK